MSYILIFTKGYLLNFSFHYRMRLKKILVCKSCQIHNPFIWYIHRFLLIFFWEGLFKFCINNYRPKYAVHTQIHMHLYTHIWVVSACSVTYQIFWVLRSDYCMCACLWISLWKLCYIPKYEVNMLLEMFIILLCDRKISLTTEWNMSHHVPCLSHCW